MTGRERWEGGPNHAVVAGQGSGGILDPSDPKAFVAASGYAP